MLGILLCAGTARAQTELRVDQLIMKASHNSYARRESLPSQVDDYNCWSIELDLQWSDARQCALVAHDCPRDVNAPTLESYLDTLASAPHDNVVFVYLEIKSDGCRWPYDRSSYWKSVYSAIDSTLHTRSCYPAAEFKLRDAMRWPSYQELRRRGYRYVVILDETALLAERNQAETEDGFFFGATHDWGLTSRHASSVVLVNAPDPPGGGNDSRPTPYTPRLRDGRWLYRVWPDGDCSETDGAYWTANLNRRGVGFNFIATNCIDHADENVLPVQSSDPVYVDANANNTEAWGTRGKPYHDAAAARERLSPGARLLDRSGPPPPRPAAHPVP